jgi:hypothetical protein
MTSETLYSSVIASILRNNSGGEVLVFLEEMNMADKSTEEGSSKSTSDGQNNEEFKTVSRRKRKKYTAEDMDTSVSAKRPSFPPLSGESLTV